MKKIKYFILAFALATALISVNNVVADDGLGNDYKYSNYVQTQQEAEELIEKHGTRHIQSENDTWNDKEYKYFVGYDAMTHKAIYTNKMSIQPFATVTKNIKTVGTWTVGSYWGERMEDSNGDPVYCGTYGANYPVGSFKYVLSESTKVKNGLSYGYKYVNTSESASVKYGKTQLALWKGQGKNSVAASTLGVYQKVADAYKGNIKSNLKTFDIPKGSAAKIINSINMSNSYAINGTASFKFTSTQLKKVTDKGASLYIYNKNTKKWVKVKANTNYSNTTYSAIRMGTSDMTKDISTKDIKITLNVPKVAGYIWKIENSGYQDIFSFKLIDPVETFDMNFNLKAQTGDIKVLKQMDDIDLYEQEINISGQEYYKTKDGKPVMFKTELGELSVAEKLRYATKEEFVENDLYEKVFTYEYLDYENAQELVTDLNGVNPGEEGYIETYADVIDSDTGYSVVVAKKDAEGNYIYANATTTFNMPNKETMNNEYKAQKSDNVEFTLYKADKKTVLKSGIVDKGELEFTGLLPGTYYVKETKTKDSFNLINTWYKADVKVGATTTINNSKAIINEINFSELYISKTDVTGEIELDGAHMQLIDSDDNVVDEWISKAGDPHYVKVAKGTYYIKETIAPEGRDLLTTLIPVNILENGEVIHVKVKNELIEADIEVSKTDVTGEKELSGAKMCLTEKNGEDFVIGLNGEEKTVDEYCWTSTDKAKKMKLYYGNYLIDETIAPQGYIKVNTKIPLSVAENGVIPVKVKNEAIKIPLAGGLNVNELDGLNKTYQGFNALN